MAWWSMAGNALVMSSAVIAGTGSRGAAVIAADAAWDMAP
jgi:hypothetical protein